jgi:hypothetical protein
VAGCAWVNQMSGLTGTTGTPGPLAQGAFTIVRRPRSVLGRTRWSSDSRAVQGMVAETGDLDCATIVQRDLDDRSG